MLSPRILSVAFYVACVTTLGPCLLPAQATDMTGESAQNFIDKLGREAINTLTNASHDSSTVEANFLKLLQRDFEVASIARFVMGKYWRLATESQKKKFEEIFTHRLKKAYANRFKDYRGIVFKVISERKNGGYTLVKSTIQRPSGPEIDVEWWVKGRKIYDVVIDGISMRMTLRDDYNSLISTHGGNLDKFLQDLSQK